jgi:uncharacterized RDD family membrane protein YckC
VTARPIGGLPRALPHRTYAGLITRVLGLGVDVLVLTAVVIATDQLPTLAWQAVIGPTPHWLETTTAILARALPFGYFAGFWWLGGQTAGALLVGVAVRRPDGRHLGPIRAVLRAVVCLALAPLWAIGLLAVLWDGERRALHDILFSTVVRHVGRHTPPD